ncbi:MAG: hypothetical protein AVDCRST_MAG89-416, partial [uncultured Gemmatimonadetes bacterium]
AGERSRGRAARARGCRPPARRHHLAVRVPARPPGPVLSPRRQGDVLLRRAVREGVGLVPRALRPRPGAAARRDRAHLLRGRPRAAPHPCAQPRLPGDREPARPRGAHLFAVPAPPQEGPGDRKLRRRDPAEARNPGRKPLRPAPAEVVPGVRPRAGAGAAARRHRGRPRRGPGPGVRVRRAAAAPPARHRARAGERRLASPLAGPGQRGHARRRLAARPRPVRRREPGQAARPQAGVSRPAERRSPAGSGDAGRLGARVRRRHRVRPDAAGPRPFRVARV